MRMTALDIQNHVFPRKLAGGYDVDEVEQFRNLLVEDWADLCTEADELRRRVSQLEARVEDMSTQERALRDALVTAQGLSDDLRRTAEREAQMRVGAAEIQAEKILAAAHGQASRLAHDVRELRTLRSRLAGAVRATIETHLALLEGFSRDADEELEPAPAQLAAIAAPPTEIEARDESASQELFGPPGPPKSLSEDDETEAAIAAALAAEPEVQLTEEDVVPGGTLAEPLAEAVTAAEPEPGARTAEPRPRRPEAPAQGWRVFFGPR